MRTITIVVHVEDGYEGAVDDALDKLLEVNDHAGRTVVFNVDTTNDLTKPDEEAEIRNAMDAA